LAKNSPKHLTGYTKFSSNWILGYSSTKRQEDMNAILRKIAVAASPEDVVSDNQLYSLNLDSLQSILNEDLYDKKFARYVLLRYEYLKMSDTVHLTSYKNLSVEHILPQNPSRESHWVKDFSEKERTYWTNKLGNLTLISRRKNSAMGNLDFSRKKEQYLKNRIEVFVGTRVFIEAQGKWTPKVVEKRQQEMVKTPYRVCC
jgi:hypothetical protein